ncbi:MAG: type II toxin-antitoxin system VapC family toxin [Chthoniobacterales bacterium]
MDTAIIIKLLVDEPDSHVFRQAIPGNSISTSELAVTEVLAALLAKERTQSITELEREQAWKEFSSWIADERLEIHSMDSLTLKKARHTLDRCHPSVPLRTLDSIHVAACDSSQDFPLCATDKRMRDAAKLLHIPVFPE